MTDKMFDEKGLRAGGETDPEAKARRSEQDADVEGHRLASFEPEKTREPGRMAARDEDESPDVEGHLRAMEPEKTREPGRMAARDEDDDDGEGEGVRSA